MKHTTEEKKEYFKNLRDRWNTVKKSHTEQELSDAQAIIQAHGLNVSGYSFMFTKLQMEKLGYEGIPYLDCKTYQGWITAGFQVKKGEKSRISGIAWVGVEEKDSEEVKFLMPKEYKLFHRTQTEAIC